MPTFASSMWSRGSLLYRPASNTWLWSRGIRRLRAGQNQLTSTPDNHPDAPLSNNDKILPRIKNRNPLNLEKMGLGYKPSGFQYEKTNRRYWNRLDLSIKGAHTVARVTHWTGRLVCEVSTKEQAVNQFLHNFTSVAAVEAVAALIGQRCLEMGVAEVFLKIEEEFHNKEKMQRFIKSVKQSGLAIREQPQYFQHHPHVALAGKHIQSFRAWELTEEEVLRTEKTKKLKESSSD